MWALLWSQRISWGSKLQRADIKGSQKGILPFIAIEREKPGKEKERKGEERRGKQEQREREKQKNILSLQPKICMHKLCLSFLCLSSFFSYIDLFVSLHSP
eukprot:TRINITY_DN32741_c0_g1_i1.p1 TRINITY_DN32741_c0_g1~~TRINITY_DN32741_c0_g1_i1.p1  ORF type:complete len:101 (-),score=20.08 TRINITY_DN32741_c0_g1_i1:1398-1700(-)